ncbi:MAG: hypothetical protein V1729_06140 [Candidatus Woesearchaeota archaeon]
MYIDKLIRTGIFTFVLAVIAIMVTGCAQKMMCAPPNVMIGSSCCLDTNANSICDTRETPEIAPEPEPEPVVETTEQIVKRESVELFINTWNRKSYTALRGLFINDYGKKFSPKEFNFLARRVGDQLGIQSISMKGITGNDVDYEVNLGDEQVIMSADIIEEDGKYLHSPFYFFTDMSPETACVDDTSCYYDFAIVSEDRNYCSRSGDKREACIAHFGESKNIDSKIRECNDINDYYSKAQCLTTLAVAENDVEPCWDAGYDKQLYGCMGEVAAARNDVNSCTLFVKSRGFSATRLQKTYCITGFVRVTENTTACGLIDRRSDVVLGSLQEACYHLEFP